MILPLTAEQLTALAAFQQPGFVLLARLDRETFNGSNAATSGTMRLLCTSIPDDRLAAVRAAIAGEKPPAKRKAKP